MDPIADFLTQIRNAYKAKHETVTSPHSKIKAELALLLKQTGFLGDVSVEGTVPSKFLKVGLVYQGSEPILSHISRVSKPSVRIYTRSSKIPTTLSGRGLTILSTSKGLMTDRQAKKAALGGEIICRVW